MSIRTLLSLVALLGGVALGYWHRAEIELRLCRLQFPAGWRPPSGWTSNNHTVPGILGSTIWMDDLLLDDGTIVSHWLVSHHQADDIASVLFEFPNGRIIFAGNWRCCGISIEDSMRPINQALFVDAINNYNALSPLWRGPG